MKFSVVAHTPGFGMGGQQAPAVPRPAVRRAGRPFLAGARLPRTAGLEDANGGRGASGPEPHALASRSVMTMPTTMRTWSMARNRRREAGSWMPDYGLSEQEIDQLIAFMNGLE
jgi:hypothetical protein